MFIYVHGNSTTLSALEQIQTYRETIRQKTVIPRTSPETSNYSELCRNDPRKCELKHPELLHDPYPETRQDLHQPYWKSNQIKLCRTPTNEIQHDTTTSLMQHADIKDSYLLWTSQATPLKKKNFNIQPRTKTSSPNTKCKSSITPAARSGESPASSPVPAKQRYGI